MYFFFLSSCHWRHWRVFFFSGCISCACIHSGRVPLRQSRVFFLHAVLMGLVLFCWCCSAWCCCTSCVVPCGVDGVALSWSELMWVTIHWRACKRRETGDSACGHGTIPCGDFACSKEGNRLTASPGCLLHWIRGAFLRSVGIYLASRAFLAGQDVLVWSCPWCCSQSWWKARYMVNLQTRSTALLCRQVSTSMPPLNDNSCSFSSRPLPDFFLWDLMPWSPVLLRIEEENL